MPQIGAIPLSLKSPDQGFRGITTLSKTSPYYYLELENGYVNSDASEIRMVPGYVCVIDPASFVRIWAKDQPFGYTASHFAARRGAITASSGYNFELAPSELQYVWTRPTNIHGIEQLNGRWVIFGQSDFVREPILNATSTGFVRVISYDDAGATTVLTCDANPLNTANTFNAVVVNDKVTLEGITGRGAAALNGKGHVVTAVAGATITINTNIGAGAAEVGQNGYVDRVTHNGNTAGGGTTPISDDKESLTIWTCLEGGDPSQAAVQKVFPAHVFNRQRDFGDAAGIIKQGNSNAVTVNGGRSRRRQRSLPYRLVPHVAGDRLILVAPGYGCVFQAPCTIPPNFDEVSTQLGVHALCNDIYDQPRTLGVPKAVQWEDPDKSVANTAHIDHATIEPRAFGGSSAASASGRPAVNTRAGVYRFKVAYKDEATGEIGLPSEEVAVTTDNVTNNFEGINLYVYFPGYLMHECGALSINLYRTKKDGTTFFYDQSFGLSSLTSAGVGVGTTAKYGAQPEGATGEYFHHVIITPFYTTDTALEQQAGVVPSIEQMPMGCKAARTLRGFTLFGGALGNAGSRLELQSGTLTLNYDRNTNTTNGINYGSGKIGSAFTNDFSAPGAPIVASFEGAEEGFGCAARNIPPAYAGQIIAGKWFPYPRKWIQLDILKNTDVGYDGTFPNDRSGRIQDVRYSILDTPIQEYTDLQSANARLQLTHLLLPRAQVQISEPDNPGVVPATNTTVFASVRDDDIEAIGDANGQAIVCTRSATYMISFTQSPIGVPPDLANSGFGCIGANTMVSFESGAAWISERGPVAWSGGIQFIGESLERHFSGETYRYLRDGSGMMRHAWACHDVERKLIYFGVFANRAASTTPLTVTYQGNSYTWTGATGAGADADKIKSLFPCDEVLIYSYRTGAWSVWRPPLTMGIQWMARGIASDGSARIFFLGSDRRVYMMDDAYGNGDRESFRTTVVDTGTVSTLNGFTASAMSRVGLTVAVYSENATTGEAILKGTATVTVDGGTSITMDASIAVVAGDIAIVGARTMQIDTTFMNIKRNETTRAASLGLRYRLWSRFGNGGGGSKQQAFVSASAKTESPQDGIQTAKDNSLTNDSGQLTSYQWLAQDLPNAPVHETALKRGIATGQNHQLRMTFVGGAQVRLQDIYVEMQ